MNEANTLIKIENFMLQVIKDDYLWSNFKVEYEYYREEAKLIWSDELEYSPLLQAYFRLLKPRLSCRDRKIFENELAFKEFQKHCKSRHEIKKNFFIANNRHNQEELRKYINQLIQKHCKLLIVRVDLSYKFEEMPTIDSFRQDIATLVNRIQNKDTIFKDQVGYVYRLEQSSEKGYHCHLAVIYNGSKRCKDSYFGQEIGMLWKEQISDNKQGIFFNCNNSEHTRGFKEKDKLGVGMIHRDNQKELENAVNTLCYLARPEKINQYLRCKSEGMRQFSKGQTPRIKAERFRKD